MASIERQGAQRPRLGQGSGLILEKDLIATSFGNIEGARYLRVELAGGASMGFDSVVAWTRREEARF
jgi:hypothetical protein